MYVHVCAHVSMHVVAHENFSLYNFNFCLVGMWWQNIFFRWRCLFQL